MQLVDAAGGVVANRRGGDGGPLVGRQARIGEVDGDRAGGVGRQRRRVGVGDDVGLHPAGGGHVHLHLPQVLAADADPAVGVGHAPAAVIALNGGGARGGAGHLGHGAEGIAGLPGQQRDGLGGGRPQGEGGAVGIDVVGTVVVGAFGTAVAEGDAQVGAGGGLGVEAVQDDGGLHAGEGVQAPPVAVRVGVYVLGYRDLSGQGSGDGVVVEQGRAGGVGRAQGDIALQVGVGGANALGQIADDAQRRERGGGQAVRAHDATVDGGCTALGGRDQLEGQAGAGDGPARIGDDFLAVHSPGQQGHRPGQEVGSDPVGALLLAAGDGWEGRDGIECEADRVGEGHDGVLPNRGVVLMLRPEPQATPLTP